MAGWAVAAPLPASITMSIDVLDGNDPGAPSPTGLVVVDVGVDVSANDWFVSAAIVGRTFNGATLEYGLYPDPNNPLPTFLPPGLDNRFVSFGSAAYGRNDPPRFAPAGTIAEQTIGIVGDQPYPTFLPDEVGAGYFAIPLFAPSHPDAPRGRDGYIARVALDITGVELPGASDPGNYRIFTPGQVPAGFEPVFLSDPWQGLQFGTYVFSNYSPNNSFAQNWGVYVPEPHSMGALLVGSLVVIRRARTVCSMQVRQNV